MRQPSSSPTRAERGTTLAELMIALVVLSLGVLAVGQLFPAGSRSSEVARLTSSANYLAQEQLEELKGQGWHDAALTDGRHPASGFDSVGTNGQMQRSYEVATLVSPLDNLKRVTVTVQWSQVRNHAVTATTYIRQ
jgi:Tfp pilus assembly protein PilV